MAFDDVFKGQKLRVDFRHLKPVPAAKGYVAQIASAQDHFSAKGKRSIRVDFVLEATSRGCEAAKGRTITEYFPVDGDSVARLGALVAALGIEVVEEEMELEVAQFVGQKVIVDVKHDTSDGRPRARIDNPRPMPDDGEDETIDAPEDNDGPENEPALTAPTARAPGRGRERRKRASVDGHQDPRDFGHEGADLRWM